MIFSFDKKSNVRFNKIVRMFLRKMVFDESFTYANKYCSLVRTDTVCHVKN